MEVIIVNKDKCLFIVYLLGLLIISVVCILSNLSDEVLVTIIILFTIIYGGCWLVDVYNETLLK